MEPLPSSLTPDPTPPAASSREPGAAEVATEGRSRSQRFRFTPDRFQATLDDDARLRLGLQRRAVENLRAHIRRAAVRTLVLVFGDVVAFLAMRSLLRAVRDHGVLGQAIGHGVAFVMPPGALTGWQFAVALIVSLLVTGNYGHGDKRRSPGGLFVACALAVALPLWLELWSRGLGVVLLQYALTSLLIWVGVLTERLTIDWIVALVRPLEQDAARVLFVGPAERSRQAAEAPVFASGREYRVVGFVDAEETYERATDGQLARLGRVIHETRAEAVVICGYFEEQAFQQLVDTALEAGCELISVPRTLSIAGLRPTMVWRGGEPLVILTAPALQAQQLILKRLVDVVGVGVGLVLLSPLFAVIGVLVKLDSRGPVLFRQQRVGMGGRLFGVVKFRTMVDGAEGQKDDLAHMNGSGDSRLFKIPSDPRVTTLGRFLRKWSLDELPQLWNVLAGDMSLVGPRPFFPQDLKDYESHHFNRLGVRPGITGLWQVSGRSAVTDFEEVVRLDREYIDSWSLTLDLKILLRTVPAVLSKRGAY